jgi:hypothetical protein
MSPRISLRESIAVATCALLGTAAPSARADEFDASLLYWTEGSRVSVNEGVFNFRKSLPGEMFLELNLVVDVMTGASHNGATRSNEVQTFTRPSGRGGYVILPGQTPVDDTFQDNRVAARARLGGAVGRNGTGTAGIHYSQEYDYRSRGVNISYAHDFNRRNTTVALGLAFSWDTALPEGGIPVPFASMRPPGETPPRRSSSDDKYITDLLIGVTQVVNRSTLMRVNYSLNYGDGYHTDPFKIITVAETAAGPAEGDPADYVFENRPRTRTRHAIYGLVKSHFARNVLDLSYRFMRDDWGVRSHTGEARYRAHVGARRYIEPQYRFYRQSATDFYVSFLRDDTPFPEFASGDLRLGAFDAHTVAVKGGITINPGNELNLRIGYYLQIGDSSPPGAFGSLSAVDLFPTVGAYIIQVGYSSRF